MNGFAAVTFLTFFVLKLTDTIDWPWWVVTSPLWGVAALYLIVTLFVLPTLVRQARKIIEKSEGR